MGARGSSGLSDAAMWGIIGACIAVVLIVVVILIVCCCVKKRKGGAGKGKPEFPCILGLWTEGYKKKVHRFPQKMGRKLIDLQLMFFNLIKLKLYCSGFFFGGRVAGAF